MKIVRETNILSDNDFDNIISILYYRISKELKLKKEELDKNWIELNAYYRRLEEKELNNNKFIRQLEQKYKNEVFQEMDSIFRDLRKFDLFVELLLKRDDNHKGFIDLEPSDSKDRLNKSIVKIFNNKILLNDFISTTMGTILTKDYNSFYSGMCVFFHFKIEDLKIDNFSIYSRMAQILTNDLFNLYGTDQEIKTKKKPMKTTYSKSKYNTPLIHNKR